jgi:GT2 family glycosyltransferase
MVVGVAAASSPDRAPDISVVILTFDGRAWLSSCLAALTESEGDFEIVVVDNASRDGSADFVRSAFPDVRLVALDTNRGFAGGINAGCRVARGRFLALLNNDALVDPNCVRALRDALDREPWADLAAARIVFLHDPGTVDSAGDGYTPWGGAFKRLHGRPASEANEPREVFGVCGAACLFRREVFERVGGFDEDFFMVYEDVDFSFRAQLLGHRVVYVPEAVVRHAGSATLGPSSRDAIFYGQRNLEWVFLKNMPWSLLLIFLPGHVLYVLTAAVYFAATGRFRAFGAGKWAAIRGCAAMWRKRRRAGQADVGRVWRLMERRWFRLKLREKAFDRMLARAR